MTYQALYRVYRPRTFDDMVGQDIITQTLQNAIDADQTGHAYLFSGPRGTGKTSAAKIFAREVNGIDPSVADGQIPDIVEIDAASNNGVDEIRNIRDSANYAPIEAKYKIYIIDEAHMLSTGAFNALLKTLEEPPANVKFILATTEPQKMPATILSRTQRFEFKRISNQTIEKRLAYILKQQGIDHEDEALQLVANAAEGGMRDALSILDQVIAYQPEKVTAATALVVTGTVVVTQLVTYLQEISQGNTASALETLTAILADGKDAHRFLSDLMTLLRDILVVNVAPDLVRTTVSQTDLHELAQALGMTKIQTMMVAIDDMQKQIAQSLQSDVYLELLTVKLAMLSENYHEQGSTVDVQPRLAKLQPQSKQEVKSTSVTEPVIDKQLTTNEIPTEQADPIMTSDSQSTESTAPATTDPSAIASPLAYTGADAVFAVLSQAKRSQLTALQQEWNQLQDGFSVQEQAVLQTASPVAASTEGVVLAFEYPALLEQNLTNVIFQQHLQAELQVASLPTHLVMISQDQWHQYRADFVAQMKAGQQPIVSFDQLQPVAPSEEMTSPAKVESTNTSATKPDIVASAQKLFGDDIVKITDD